MRCLGDWSPGWRALSAGCDFMRWGCDGEYALDSARAVALRLHAKQSCVGDAR
jgi:hypothetical protein